MRLLRQLAPTAFVLAGIIALRGVAADRVPLRIEMSGAARPDEGIPAAVVGWPPSGGLLLAEVVTGGVSASDEYVEITNAGGAPADLVGHELVYVSASGGTVTRKAVWTAETLVDPGRHLLVANSLGRFAASADLVYSSGFAATGGTLVLRVVGGAPVDAVGWGDASNAFVEAAAAPAPPANASIERRPGGLDGNVLDTNDNASDWLVVAAPSAQNLAAPPVPAPGPTPSPSAHPSDPPTAEPTADPTAEPTPTASPGQSEEPGPSPSPTPTPTFPDPTTTLGPTASPTASASVPPTAEPSSTPLPTVTPIAVARLLPDGASATVLGVLTTQLGALESGRVAYLQDGTAGIALHLAATVVNPLPAGTAIRIEGTLADRYAARTLRIVEAGVVVLDDRPLPDPLPLVTGSLDESVEGRRVTVAGIVAETPSDVSDGWSFTLDDGSGPARVIVTPDALAGRSLVRGDRLRVVGPVGQRDTSGTGLAGYRVLVTRAADLEVPADPPPTPTPTPIPTPTQTPTQTPVPTPSVDPTDPVTPSPTVLPTLTPTPTPTSTPDGSPTPLPTASPALLPIVTLADARALPIGTRIRVAGVVTAEAGRLGAPALAALQENVAGIALRLPPASSVVRGTLLEVVGRLAQPYGQLEIRAETGSVVSRGAATLPVPATIGLDEVGEATEGRLVSVVGFVAASPTRTSAGDVSFEVVDDVGRRLRIVARSGSGIAVTSVVARERYRLVGVLGQRATGQGRLDGYRLWLRDEADLIPLAGPGGSPSPDADGADETLPLVPIATAIGRIGERVRIEGVVTAPASLLDESARRVVMEDGSAAIEVLLPTNTGSPRTGSRLIVSGTITRAYGAPRLRASGLTATGRETVMPRRLVAAPGEADEWRLVRIAGRIASVRRLGSRWIAELVVGAARIPVVGLPGAAIPSTVPIAGRDATVVGIVRRPYPTATDRRYLIVPRDRADLAIGPAPGGDGPAGSPAPSVGDDGSGPGGPAAASDAIPGVGYPVDLARLEEHLGREVLVAGVVLSRDGTSVRIDDGTASAIVAFVGDAEVLAPLVAPDDALEVRGVVGELESGLAVLVGDPAAIRLIGELGEARALLAPAACPGEEDPADAVACRAGSDPDGSDPFEDEEAVLLVGPAGTRSPTRGAAPALAASLAGLGISLVAVTLRRRRLELARSALPDPETVSGGGVDAAPRDPASGGSEPEEPSSAVPNVPPGSGRA